MKILLRVSASKSETLNDVLCRFVQKKEDVARITKLVLPSDEELQFRYTGEDWFFVESTYLQEDEKAEDLFGAFSKTNDPYFYYTLEDTDLVTAAADIPKYRPDNPLIYTY